MAQSQIITYVSDLSDKEITDNDAPTVSFALDGTAYEIDLTDAEQEKFRKILAPYVEAGRKAAGNTKATKRAVKKADGPTPAEVRAWAKENNIDVPDRGRVSSEVTDQYLAAVS
jgi:hypothetical protein